MSEYDLQKNTTYSFSIFKLDTATLTLLRELANKKGWTDVRLGHQAAVVLAYLIEHRHTLVPRDQLLDIMPKEPATELLHNHLSQALAQIRRALGDSDKKQTFIGRPQKNHVQFVYPDVREETSTPPPPPVKIPGTSKPNKLLFFNTQWQQWSRRKRLYAVAAVLFGCGIIAVSIGVIKERYVAWFPGEPPPSGGTLILVANFDRTPDTERYRFTRKLVTGLREAVKGIVGTRVEPLGSHIPWQSGSASAISQAKAHGASIIIWGDHDTTASRAEFSVHVELIDEALRTSSRRTRYEREIDAPINELNTFTFQRGLAADISAITTMVLGFTHYDRKNYPDAIQMFKQSLAQSAPNDDNSRQAYMHYMLGRSYMAVEKHSQAIEAFSLAVTLKPDLTEALRNRAIAFAMLRNFQRAEEDLRAILNSPSSAMHHATARTILGYGQLVKRDYLAAIPEYKEAIRLRANDYWAWVGLGVASEYAGQWLAAYEAFKKASELDPNSAIALFNIGRLEYCFGKLDEALRHLSTSISLNPNHSPTYIARGNVLIDISQGDKALEDFATVLAKKGASHVPSPAVELAILIQKYPPQSLVAHAYLGRSRVLFGKGRLADAARESQEALKTDIGLGQWFRRCGEWGRRAIRFKLAITECDMAVALKPEFPEGWIKRSKWHRLTGDYARSRSDLERARQINSKQTEVWIEDGNLHLETGDIENAGASFETALRLDNTSIGAHVGVAEALSRKGRAQQAIGRISKAIQRFPRSADLYGARANLYCQSGSYSQAITEFQHALKFEPENHVLYNNLADCRMRANALDGALVDANHAVLLAPLEPPLYITRGEIHHKMKAFPLAIADFERSLSLRPNYAPALLGRGLALEKLGRFMEADRDLSRVLAVPASRELKIAAEEHIGRLRR